MSEKQILWLWAFKRHFRAFGSKARARAFANEMVAKYCEEEAA